MTSFSAAGGSGRSASVIPAVPAAWSVTTIAFICTPLFVSRRLHGEDEIPEPSVIWRNAPVVSPWSPREIRSLPYVGPPNWHWLDTITPAELRTWASRSGTVSRISGSTAGCQEVAYLLGPEPLHCNIARTFIDESPGQRRRRAWDSNPQALSG